jgi:hypothetical protein
MLCNIISRKRKKWNDGMMEKSITKEFADFKNS